MCQYIEIFDALFGLLFTITLVVSDIAVYKTEFHLCQLESRRMKCAGNEVRTGEKRNAGRMLLGKRDGRNHLENLGVYGNVMLKRILEK
jgi:hypothetical protein